MSDRKYGQRGYMQDDRARRDEKRPETPRPPRDPRDAPRGRGLGSPTASNFRCARCGELATVASLSGDGAFAARCGSCGADLHTCTHCVSFDPAAPLQCRQPIIEKVAKKDVANRCEKFEPRLRQEFAAERPASGGSSPTGPKDPRAAFDALFKF